MARHPRPGDHDSGAALAAAEGSVLWPGTFTGTQLPNSALSGSTSGAAPSCTAKRCAAFMRFYGFLGCPRLVVPKLVRIMDRAAHPEGQVARLSWLDPAWVLQQQLLHFLGSSFLGDHPDEVSDRAHRWPAPLGCRGRLLHCRDALSDPDRRPGA